MDDIANSVNWKTHAFGFGPLMVDMECGRCRSTMTNLPSIRLTLNHSVEVYVAAKCLVCNALNRLSKTEGAHLVGYVVFSNP